MTLRHTDPHTYDRIRDMVLDKANDVTNALVHTEVGTMSHTELWDELLMFRALGELLDELEHKDDQIKELEVELEDLSDLYYGSIT